MIFKRIYLVRSP